jgi:glyoxylase-like metal-dependent hydrolase (beta-lactamase superfamily II)
VGNLAWSLGDVRVTRIVERELAIALAGLLPEATPGALARHRAWLEPSFLNPDGTATLSIQALVVQSSGKRILVDTCVGERKVPGYEQLSEGGRPLPSELEAAGFAPASIDVVLCTHLHFDHVGWNTVRVGGRWVPTFPNARYLFARAEWEHWSREPSSVFTASFDEAVRPVLDAGRADLVDPDHRITPEVRLEPSPGHTPGHVCVRIESRGERALVTGDATHHPVQWAEPGWRMVADTDPAQAVATRRRLRAACAGEGALVIGTHYAPPCAGHVVAAGGGFVFRARR